MKHWESLLDLSYKKKDTIEKVLAPLKDYFDIHAVGYFKITRQGNFSYFTNKPETMQAYIEKGLLSKDPFYRHPNFYQNQLIVVNEAMSSASLDPELSDFLSSAAGYQGGFYYLNLTSEGMEGYEFGYHAHSRRIERFLQDKMLMESFFTFFKKETKDLRSLTEQNSLSLIHEVGELFFSPPGLTTSFDEKEKQEFLNLIGLSNNEFIELHLTERELDCISLYLQRKTAPETAKILHLSTRTIENYFENIKEKLNCRHKSEIYEKIKGLVLQGYYSSRLGQFF